MKRFLMVLIILVFMLQSRGGYPSDGLKNDKDMETLTLEMSIKVAVENNTSIKRELERLKATGEEVKKAFADFLPKFSINYSYTS